ncbi:putative 2-hydroxyacid dehydrogenase [Papiliotrema laurentii]|uniref:2-hydroxyacid dehydrogenase n=1 Tax=Papiliotrema laurentii TaxID=5418 RepID=A0AAD9CSE8_PAPLA|nr:putative 2-hydroxyacid dehydrogenase [Papiliotrema laurentii]
MPYLKDKFFAEIEPLADIVQFSSQSYDELERDFGKKYKGVKVIYHYRDPGSYFGHLGEEFFQRVPPTCQVVSHLGAGYDDIDVAAAKRHNIVVTHTPSAVDDATATTAIYLVISAMRQFAKAEIACRAGQWKKHLPLARDPEHKTLGIVGMGGIGTVTARRLALGWGMRVIYHNRRRLAVDPDDFEVEYKDSLEGLLNEADIVSLHLPYSTATKNMFSHKQFAAMKQGSVFVNTARGGLVDEEALLAALDAGKLHGAGLDVYPDEPKINPKLFDHPNVTLLPHMGTETWDSRDKMAQMVLDNILACLSDKPLPSVVPEHR